jgi:hypothetical protein
MPSPSSTRCGRSSKSSTKRRSQAAPERLPVQTRTGCAATSSTTSRHSNSPSATAVRPSPEERNQDPPSPRASRRRVTGLASDSFATRARRGVASRERGWPRNEMAYLLRFVKARRATGREGRRHTAQGPSVRCEPDGLRRPQATARAWGPPSPPPGRALRSRAGRTVRRRCGGARRGRAAVTAPSGTSGWSSSR